MWIVNGSIDMAIVRSMHNWWPPTMSNLVDMWQCNDCAQCTVIAMRSFMVIISMALRQLYSYFARIFICSELWSVNNQLLIRAQMINIDIHFSLRQQISTKHYVSEIFSFSYFQLHLWKWKKESEAEQRKNTKQYNYYFLVCMFCYSETPNWR